MLTKIETQEIMTLKEMAHKYRDKWFRFILVGEPDLVNAFNSKGYVVYTADTEDELFEIKDIQATSIYAGLNAYSPSNYGGVREYTD